MITDALVAFVPLGGNLSLVGAASATIASSVFDLIGPGVGQPPGNIIGNAALFGTDEGVGGKRPELNISIGTAVVAASSSTLKIALQAAPDTGAAGGYLPGTWSDIVSQDGLTAALLVANAVPFRTPFLPTMPPGLRPRYMRLLFTISSLGALTAGTVSSALVTMVRDDQANKYAARNYSVA